jgi:ABC-type branched-subunit amino acid transport system ATPase component
VGGLQLTDYDVPKATSLLLVGPKGSGKSSLVNRISRVFEEDKFVSDRAQVSCTVL